MNVQRELEALICPDLPSFVVLRGKSHGEPDGYGLDHFWLVLPPAADLIGFPRIYGQVMVSHHDGCYYQISHWSLGVRFWDPKRAPIQEGLEVFLAGQPDSVSVIALPVPLPIAGPLTRLKLWRALLARRSRQSSADHSLSPAS